MSYHIAGLGLVTESSNGNHSSDGGAESQRRDERDSLFVLAQLKREGATDSGETVRVRNVSSGGLMAEAPDIYRPGTRVEVELEALGTVTGSVAWAEAGRVGIAFDHPIDKTMARKPRVAKTNDLFRPLQGDHRRPGIKPR